MQPVGTFTVGPEHPSLAGHFPGQPVVPGVVLLDEVFALLAAGGVAELPLVKFLAPVRPGQVVTVAAAPASGGRVAFAGTVEGRGVLRGVLLLEPG